MKEESDAGEIKGTAESGGRGSLSAKKGDKKKSELKGPSREMYESMSKKQLEEFASGNRKAKPEHKSKSE